MSCADGLCVYKKVANRIDASSIRFNLIGTVISAGLTSACVGYLTIASTLRGLAPFPNAGTVFVAAVGSIAWFACTVFNIRGYARRIDERSSGLRA